MLLIVDRLAIKLPEIKLSVVLWKQTLILSSLSKSSCSHYLIKYSTTN